MKRDKECREIEVRFLEIDVEGLIHKLMKVGATDRGEDFFREIIFYDKASKWQYEEKKFVRIRQTNKNIFVTFKHNEEDTATGTKEIEFEIKNLEVVKKFLEEVGLVAFREQEKRRHTFILDEVVVDIDTWPSIPTYVELEGSSEEALKGVAAKIG